MIRKIFFFVLMALPGVGYGQGFQVNLQGQKQNAMAGAGAGLALDEAAIYFNPGAVAMLSKNGINAGASALFFKSAFRESGSAQTFHNLNEIAPPFEFYGAWGPSSEKYKVGIGIYTPFGGLVNWGDQWAGRYTLRSLDFKAIYFQPTLSVKLSDQVALGAGFVYNYGTVNLQKMIPVVDDAGNVGHATLKGTGKGYGWNAGIYFKTESGISIGITHHSKVITKLNNGDALFNVPGSLQSGFPAGNKFNSELPLPATTTLGLGFYPSAKTTIAFDINWVGWHIYKSLNFDYKVQTALLMNSQSPRNYKDAASLKLGIQQDLSPSWQARAGIGYVFSPVLNGYVTPEVPDANRVVLSAGLGYRINNLKIDASFLFEDLQQRNQTNLETSLSGAFKTLIYVPGISFSYQF